MSDHAREREHGSQPEGTAPVSEIQPEVIEKAGPSPLSALYETPEFQRGWQLTLAIQQLQDVAYAIEYYSVDTNDPDAPEPIRYVLASKADAEIASLRQERDAMQRRAEAAEADWQAAEAERDALIAALTTLEGEWRKEADRAYSFLACADALAALLAPRTTDQA